MNHGRSLANLMRMKCRTFSMALTAMRDLSLAFRTAELKSEKHGDQPHPNIVSCIVADVNSAGRTCSLPNKAVQWCPWNLCIPFFGPRHIPPPKMTRDKRIETGFLYEFLQFFLLLLHQGSSVESKKHAGPKSNGQSSAMVIEPKVSFNKRSWGFLTIFVLLQDSEAYIAKYSNFTKTRL